MKYLKRRISLIAMGFAILTCNTNLAAQDTTTENIADIVFVVDLGFGRRNQAEWLTGQVEPQVESVVRKIDQLLTERDAIARYGLVFFDEQNVVYVDFREASQINPLPDDLWVSSRDLGKLEEKLRQGWDGETVFDPNSNGAEGQAAIMRVLGLEVAVTEDDGSGPNGPNGGGEDYGLEPAYEFRDGAKTIVFISAVDTKVVESPAHHERNVDIKDVLIQKEISILSITNSLFGGNALETDVPFLNNKFRFQRNGLTWTKPGFNDPWPESEEYVEVLPSEFKEGFVDNMLYLELQEYRVALRPTLYPGSNAQIIEKDWSIQTKFMIKKAGGNARVYFGQVDDFDPDADDGGVGELAFLQINANCNADGHCAPGPSDWVMRSNWSSQADLNFNLHAPERGWPEIKPHTWYTIELRATDTNLANSRFDLFVAPATAPQQRTGMSAANANSNPYYQMENMHYLGLGSYQSNTAFDDFTYSYLPVGDHIAPEMMEPTPFDFAETTDVFNRMFFNDFGSNGSSFEFDVHGIDWIDSLSSAAAYFSSSSADREKFVLKDGTDGIHGNGVHVRSAIHNNGETGYQGVNYVKLAESSGGSAWSILPILNLATDSFSEAFIDGVDADVINRLLTEVDRIELGELGWGVAVLDYAYGRGHLMYSEENVSDRFDAWWLNSEHVIAVRYKEGGYDYYDVGNPRVGIFGDDGATGTGYIMYTAQKSKTRFGIHSAADHFVCVRQDELRNAWQYHNNATWNDFATEPSDRLVAQVNFDPDVGNEVIMLEGSLHVIGGIDAGYSQGHLVITADRWNGRPNRGEFEIQRGYFEVENDKKVAGWEYNDNLKWVEFIPSPTDRLIADVDFTNTTTTTLRAQFGTIQGIHRGFLGGDMGFLDNHWRGVYNYGDFSVSGSHFTILSEN